MTTAQLEAIRRHGENLKLIFTLPPSTDPVKLCKRLRRLEIRAHRDAEDYCNGVIDQTTWDSRSTQNLKTLCFMLGDGPAVKECFINGDPRGYALKIDDEFCKDKRIYKDWGGYGIIAPEINEKGE